MKEFWRFQVLRLRLDFVCLYSLYIQHHVRDGLLFVLLVVVEENLLAANYDILDTQQKPLSININIWSWRLLKEVICCMMVRKAFLPMFPLLLLIVEPTWIHSKKRFLKLTKIRKSNRWVGRKFTNKYSSSERHQCLDLFYTTTKIPSHIITATSYLFHPSEPLGVIPNGERQPALQSGFYMRYRHIQFCQHGMF